MSEKFEQLHDLAAEKFDFSKISNDFIVNMIYNSLSFEKSFITKEEVADILAGKEQAGQNAALVLNHRNAFDYIVSLAKDKEPLTEDIIKNIHARLFTGIEDGAGLYRNVQIYVKGSQHVPYAPDKIYGKMDEYLYKITQYTDPLQAIAYSHLQLAKIHPFLNGNGRVTRLVLNYSLMVRGYAPIIILASEKEKYFGLLETYKVEKQITPFLDYLTEREEAALAEL